MNKYIYLWVLQGNYHYGTGWEDLTAGTYSEMRQNKKDYEINEQPYMRVSYRLVQRREPNQEAIR